MINLTDQAAEVEAPTESVGGSFTNKTNIYPATIKGCYYGESQSGAAYLKLTLALVGGSEHSEQIYFSTNKSNGSRITYTDKEDKVHLLPGAQTLASVFYAALAENVAEGTSLKDILLKVLDACEDQEVKLWDFAAGKMVTKTMPVPTAVIGKSFLAGIKEVVRPKSVKTDNGYVDSANETYDSRNELSLVFTANKISPVEIIAGAEAASHDSWIDKWKDEVVTIKPRKQKGIDPIQSKDGKPIGEASAEVSSGDDGIFG